MLVLTRKPGEDILVGDNIRIIVTKIGRGQVSLGIEAPKSVAIMRGELLREEEPHAQAGVDQREL